MLTYPTIQAAITEQMDKLQNARMKLAVIDQEAPVYDMATWDVYEAQDRLNRLLQIAKMIEEDENRYDEIRSETPPLHRPGQEIARQASRYLQRQIRQGQRKAAAAIRSIRAHVHFPRRDDKC